MELVQGIVAAAVLRAADELGWDEIARAVAVEVERPGDPAHGDYATNIAMKLTRILRKPPLEIAEAVRARIAVDDLVASVEVAKPGFVNLRLRTDWLASYEPSPGTAAFLGYGSTTQPPAGSRLVDLQRVADGFFVKLAYQFRR